MVTLNQNTSICSVCRDEIHESTWYQSWFEKNIFELPNSIYKNPSCIHKIHAVCARRWYSSDNEYNKGCPECRETFLGITTLKEAHQKTMKKVMALTLFVFGAMGGGMVAKYLIPGNMMMSVFGMMAGLTLAKKAVVSPQIQWGMSPFIAAIDYSYCLYYGIQMSDIRK